MYHFWAAQGVTNIYLYIYIFSGRIGTQRGRKCYCVLIIITQLLIVETILFGPDRIPRYPPLLTHKMRRNQGITLWRCLILLLGIQCQSFLHSPSFSLASRSTSRFMVEEIFPAAINGDISLVSDDINITEYVNSDELFPLAPPVSFEKFLTMQVCASLFLPIGIDDNNQIIFSHHFLFHLT